MNSRETKFFEDASKSEYFQVDPDATALSEFGRLATQSNWTIGGDAWKKHWHACFGTEYRLAKVAAMDCAPESPSQGVPQHSQKAAPQEQDAVRRGFLNGFERFTPKPMALLAAEFDRLAVHNGWPKVADKKAKEEAAKLAELQALCAEVRIPAQQSIRKCKEVNASTIAR